MDFDLSEIHKLAQGQQVTLEMCFKSYPASADIKTRHCLVPNICKSPMKRWFLGDVEFFVEALLPAEIFRDVSTIGQDSI